MAFLILGGLHFPACFQATIQGIRHASVSQWLSQDGTVCRGDTGPRPSCGETNCGKWSGLVTLVTNMGHAACRMHARRNDTTITCIEGTICKAGPVWKYLTKLNCLRCNLWLQICFTPSARSIYLMGGWSLIGPGNCVLHHLLFITGAVF